MQQSRCASIPLQAVAQCFSRSGTGCERVSAREMVAALEYFIVPESMYMWPAGLLCAVVYRDKLDGIANRVMSQVKADITAASGQPDELQLQIVRSDAIVFKYCLYQHFQSTGPTDTICCEKYTPPFGYERALELSAPLQERIVSLGKASFLSIRANTTRSVGLLKCACPHCKEKSLQTATAPVGVPASCA